MQLVRLEKVPRGNGAAGNNVSISTSRLRSSEVPSAHCTQTAIEHRRGFNLDNNKAMSTFQRTLYLHYESFSV
jgi:hypothetical protein